MEFSKWGEYPPFGKWISFSTIADGHLWKPGWTQPGDDQLEAGWGWKEAIGGKKKKKTRNYCHNAVFSMYFLSHNFQFFVPDPIIPLFPIFSSSWPREQRAPVLQVPRGWEAPPVLVGSIRWLFFLWLYSFTSLTLFFYFFSPFHLFFFLCLTTPQCWSIVYGDRSFCYCSLSFDLFFVLSFVLVSLFDHFP